VGKTWKFVIKYLLPCVLIVMWVIGIISLFSTAKPFELIIDVVIIVMVLAFAALLTKVKPANE